MAYRVELARNAEVELEELYRWGIQRAPGQGAAWFNGFERAILSLEQLPKRCRIAPESFNPERPVRVFNYGRSEGTGKVAHLSAKCDRHVTEKT
jgi:plasmid stabilization system protein ParE